MPKEKPISLFPLKFDDVLRTMINTPPSPKAVKTKRQANRKSKSKQ